MAKKPGRNDPCWCGSGLKYKKCHINREKQEPLRVSEADKALSKAFSTGECLAPGPVKANCSKNVIKSHTIPKRQSLQQIARNGHVYSYVVSLGNIIKHSGKLKPQLVGINSASTFTGFCSVHDNDIFSKIEDHPFLHSQEQCFLLAYRALAREVYAKRAEASLFDLLSQADRGKSLDQQLTLQTKNRWFKEGVLTGLRDIEHHKAEYDKVLISEDNNDVRAYIIESATPPPIMCSAGLFPEQDFDGNQLQDISNLEVTPDLITITSFYGEDRGLIVFAWLPGSDAICQPFINSLRKLPPNRMTDGLIRFFFEFFENLHIKPEWWENLSDKKRNSLIDRLTASANINLPRKSGCIADDGIRYDNWPIRNLKTVGF